MAKQLVTCRAVAQPIGPYSLAVRCGNLVFVSGTVGWRPDGSVPPDIREQCRQMYENMRQVLSSAGSSLEDVVGTTTYLVKASDYQALNDIRALVGYLSPRSGPGDEDEAFRQGLREQGYVPGRDIVIEYRWATISHDGLRLAADDLVRLKVDILVAASGPAVQAAKAATTTIPIVIQAAADPVGSGFIASLARPGGNITGLSLMIPDLAEKQLELLRSVIPKLSRVAYMAQAASTYRPQLQQAQAAAEKVGVHLQPVVANVPEGFEGAFAAIRGKADALWVQPIFSSDSVQRIHDLALRERLPTVSSFPLFAQAGLMLSYGPNHLSLPRRAAVYVDKILKGANPADLPVEQPTKLDLVINLKTAKALGLTIPPSLLLRADQVIE